MAIADTGKTIDDFTEEDFSLLLEKYQEVGLPVTIDVSLEYDLMMAAFNTGNTWYKFSPDPAHYKDVLVIKEMFLPRGNSYGFAADKNHKELYVHAYILPFSHRGGSMSALQEYYHQKVRDCFGINKK